MHFTQSVKCLKVIQFNNDKSRNEIENDDYDNYENDENEDENDSGSDSDNNDNDINPNNENSNNENSNIDELDDNVSGIDSDNKKRRKRKHNTDRNNKKSKQKNPNNSNLSIKFISLKPPIIYLITALISYVATIPPGPLSVYVVHTTLQKSLKIAMWVACGGVLCESTYAYLATESIFIFDKYPAVAMAVRWGIIGLLVLVGTITFFQKPAQIQSEEVSAKGRVFSFFKGI